MPQKNVQGDDDRRWSGEVTRNSDALDLEEGVFTLKSPRKIALSLKRSAEARFFEVLRMAIAATMKSPPMSPFVK